MNLMLKYLKTLGIVLLIIVVSNIIVSTLNYFGIINGNTLKVIDLLIPIIAFIYGGFRIGTMSTKKGYLEGLKISLIYTVMATIVNLIFNSIKWYNILYYIILIAITMFSSMIGINKKRI